MLSKLHDEFQSPLRSFIKDESVSLPVAESFLSLAGDRVYRHSMNGFDEPARRFGIVFSGGPAPGGHDVLVGILTHLRKGDELVGFLGGFGGLLQGRYFLIDPMDHGFLSGTAGFDYLGTDRTKVSTPEHFDTIKQLFHDMDLDGLFVVGGDDSNTNAMHLAQALGDEYSVIGIPKTIDGDLIKLPYLPVTFGFHSATQCYASSVQGLMVDAHATGKYFHFVKLMGRNASHVVLEVAHQVHPHGSLLAEDVQRNGYDLKQVIHFFTQIIQARVNAGKPYGVMIFPEGLADVIPEINDYMNGNSEPLNHVLSDIGLNSIQELAIDEDSHGNKNLSSIPLERILMDGVQACLNQMSISNVKMMSHFFGYEGRSNKPTGFDSHYSKLLGKTAYELALSRLTGVIVGCQMNDEFVIPNGIPLAALTAFDEKKNRWLIKKMLVDSSEKDYVEYMELKDNWVMDDPSFPRLDPFEIPKRFINKGDLDDK